MDTLQKIAVGLLSMLLGIALIAYISINFGKSQQQQTDDQANQISTMKNNPKKGTIDIDAITGSQNPSNAQVWE